MISSPISKRSVKNAIENVNTLIANLEEKENNVSDREVKQLYENINQLMWKVSDSKSCCYEELEELLYSFKSGMMTPYQLESFIVAEQKKSEFILNLSAIFGEHLALICEQFQELSLAANADGNSVMSEHYDDIGAKLRIVCNEVNSVAKIINSPTSDLHSTLGSVEMSLAGFQETMSRLNKRSQAIDKQQLSSKGSGSAQHTPHHSLEPSQYSHHNLHSAHIDPSSQPKDHMKGSIARAASNGIPSAFTPQHQRGHPHGQNANMMLHVSPRNEHMEKKVLVDTGSQTAEQDIIRPLLDQSPPKPTESKKVATKHGKASKKKGGTDKSSHKSSGQASNNNNSNNNNNIASRALQALESDSVEDFQKSISESKSEEDFLISNSVASTSRVIDDESIIEMTQLKEQIKFQSNRIQELEALLSESKQREAENHELNISKESMMEVLSQYSGGNGDPTRNVKASNNKGQRKSSPDGRTDDRFHSGRYTSDDDNGTFMSEDSMPIDLKTRNSLQESVLPFIPNNLNIHDCSVDGGGFKALRSLTQDPHYTAYSTIDTAANVHHPPRISTKENGSIVSSVLFDDNNNNNNNMNGSSFNPYARYESGEYDSSQQGVRGLNSSGKGAASRSRPASGNVNILSSRTNSKGRIFSAGGNGSNPNTARANQAHGGAPMHLSSKRFENTPRGVLATIFSPDANPISGLREKDSKWHTAIALMNSAKNKSAATFSEKHCGTEDLLLFVREGLKCIHFERVIPVSVASQRPQQQQSEPPLTSFDDELLEMSISQASRDDVNNNSTNNLFDLTSDATHANPNNENRSKSITNDLHASHYDPNLIVNAIPHPLALVSAPESFTASDVDGEPQFGVLTATGHHPVDNKTATEASRISSNANKGVPKRPVSAANKKSKATVKTLPDIMTVTNHNAVDAGAADTNMDTRGRQPQRPPQEKMTQVGNTSQSAASSPTSRSPSPAPVQLSPTISTFGQKPIELDFLTQLSFSQTPLHLLYYQFGGVLSELSRAALVRAMYHELFVHQQKSLQPHVYSSTERGIGNSIESTAQVTASANIIQQQQQIQSIANLEVNNNNSKANPSVLVDYQSLSQSVQFEAAQRQQLLPTYAMINDIDKQSFFDSNAKHFFKECEALLLSLQNKTNYCFTNLTVCEKNIQLLVELIGDSDARETESFNKLLEKSYL